MVRVTPASSYWREALPGLESRRSVDKTKTAVERREASGPSHGPLPRPQSAASRHCAFRRSAPFAFLWREFLNGRRRTRMPKRIARTESLCVSPFGTSTVWQTALAWQKLDFFAAVGHD